MKNVWSEEEEKSDYYKSGSLSNLHKKKRYPKPKINSGMSDTSEQSAGLRSIAGSHVFNTNSSNLDSVFGSTTGSGSAFASATNASPLRTKQNGFRGTQSTLNVEAKYLSKEELTPFQNTKLEW